MSVKAYRRLKTNRALTRVMQWHYVRARYFRWGRPVAWVTSGAPVEVLLGMGIIPVYPENYGALCGARRVGSVLCEAAEAEGFGADLCSYAKCHLGSMVNRSAAPLGGLPLPDLLFACNNICGTVMKWYEAIAEKHGIPLFFLDTPFVRGAVETHAADYVLEQLRELIREMSAFTGRRFSKRAFARAVQLAMRATMLWREIREMCATKPSPLNAPDLFVNMGPIVVLRGTERAVAFYTRLRDEVAERVRAGVGAIPEERHRLVWDNIAIWYGLYRFFNEFARRGACFITDTYTGAWAMELPDGDPLEGVAKTYSGVLLNRDIEYRRNLLVDLVQRFGANGFVMHSNRSCKPYSLLQYDLRRMVSAQTGVPGLVIEADMCDPRAYAAEQVKTRVHAFLETLDAAAEV